MAEREKQETLSETKELVTILQYEKKKKKKKTSSMHIHATGHHQKIQDILFW